MKIPARLASHKSAFPEARLLIVDDEHGLRRTLSGLFRHLGYRVVEAASGPEALEQIAKQPFDLVILDLKMPEMDGTEVLEAARPLAPDTVFIILTAYGTLDSAITGIRHGAFDYLLKPSPVERILQSVEAGLAEQKRRTLQKEDPVALLERALHTLKGDAAAEIPEPLPPSPRQRFLQVRGITVDLQRQLVVVNEQPIDLTPTEFELLTYLMQHPDRVVSCREMAAHIRGCEMDERDARVLLRSHIHRLRKKIETSADVPKLIQTVRGSGYMLVVRDQPLSS
ncbi:MAG: response regulator transcription factor [Anaerolineae bacterium]|jgi:two-component system KDP operon response regulator KdpE